MAVELPVHPDALGVVAVDVVAVAHIVGLEFHAASVAKTMADTSSGEGRGFASHVNLRVAAPQPHAFRKAPGASFETLVKSSKLASVSYDIRGPVLDKARQMEEEGQKIIKLNIGNVAAFGLMPPDEIVQDMIRNLPDAAGYTDSKGLFAPRKAVVHYTQQQGVKGVSWTMSTWAMARPS